MKIRKFSLRKPRNFNTSQKQKRVRIIKVPRKLQFKNEKLKKGIYILPSLFTCGNLSLGLISVIYSIKGDFIMAAWFLIGALACDIVDGRIARMTKTTSVFGMELDSLSDLVSFGVAPAVMMYLLVLAEMEIAGIAIAVLFVICTALRLARFNVLSQSGEIHRHFIGLPTPASAGLIVSFVLSYQLLIQEEYSDKLNPIPALTEFLPKVLNVMPIVMVVLSFLMVSNIPYMSFKKMKLSRVRTIELLAVLIVLIILIIVYPQSTIFIIFSGYAVSGLLFYIPYIIKERKNKKDLISAEKAEVNDV